MLVASMPKYSRKVILALKLFKDFLDSYNTSFIELVSWKFTITRVALGELKRYILNFSINKFSTLRKLKQTKSGTAVICSLGPSLYEDKESMRHLLLKASDNKSLFVINHYLLTEFSDIIPTYQFLSDDHFFNGEDHNNNYLSKVENFPEVTIFTRMANNYRFKNKSVVYFSGVNYPTVTKRINPQFIGGFADATILYALATALYMGYSKIIICGFDNNRFMQIKSVSPGSIYFKNMHVYSDGNLEKWGTRDTMLKVLSSHLVILKSLLLFKQHNILIVGNSSLVDIFPKIDIKTASNLLDDN
jgi:hypothetical protein